MTGERLWKYCTPEHRRELILSLRLLEGMDWEDDRVISCLYAVSRHTEKHYGEALIPKSGGGVRRLLVPDPILLLIQKNILHHVLDGLTVSPYAAAYRRGKPVLENAVPHVGKDLLLKLDITDFFGSISFSSALGRAFPSVYFPAPVQMLLTSLCFCGDTLPQGSPTSPAISNLVMKPFDDYMGAWCKERRIDYTRYSDDMTFSGNFDPHAVKRKAGSFLEAMGFALNEKKTKIISAGGHQAVTGIVVNEKPQIGREYRKKLRQEIYYCEKFGIRAHLEKRNMTEYLKQGAEGERRFLASLRGKTDYVLSVNPGDAWFSGAKRRMKNW